MGADASIVGANAPFVVADMPFLVFTKITEMYAWKTFKEILKLYHNFNPWPNFTGNTFIQHIIARVLYCIVFFFNSKMYCIVLSKKIPKGIVLYRIFFHFKNVLYCIDFLILKN